jgi:hypothetical protein
MAGGSTLGWRGRWRQGGRMRGLDFGCETSIFSRHFDLLPVSGSA